MIYYFRFQSPKFDREAAAESRPLSTGMGRGTNRTNGGGIKGNDDARAVAKLLKAMTATFRSSLNRKDGSNEPWGEKEEKEKKDKGKMRVEYLAGKKKRGRGRLRQRCNESA